MLTRGTVYESSDSRRTPRGRPMPVSQRARQGSSPPRRQPEGPSRRRGAHPRHPGARGRGRTERRSRLWSPSFRRASRGDPPPRAAWRRQAQQLRRRASHRGATGRRRLEERRQARTCCSQGKPHREHAPGLRQFRHRVIVTGIDDVMPHFTVARCQTDTITPPSEWSSTRSTTPTRLPERGDSTNVRLPGGVLPSISPTPGPVGLPAPCRG